MLDAEVSIPSATHRRCVNSSSSTCKTHKGEPEVQEVPPLYPKFMMARKSPEKLLNKKKCCASVGHAVLVIYLYKITEQSMRNALVNCSLRAINRCSSHSLDPGLPELSPSLKRVFDNFNLKFPSI